MRHNGLRDLIPRGGCDDCDVAASARRCRGGAPRSAARRAAGAPECAPAGHSGTGHGHRHGCVRHVTSDASGGTRGAAGKGTVRAGGTGPVGSAVSARRCVVAPDRDRRSAFLARHGRSPIRRLRQFPALNPTAGRVGRKAAVLCHAQEKSPGGGIDDIDAPPGSTIGVNRLRAAIRRDDPRPGTSIPALGSEIAAVATVLPR
jgi:hypothetical protein